MFCFLSYCRRCRPINNISNINWQHIHIVLQNMTNCQNISSRSGNQLSLNFTAAALHGMRRKHERRGHTEAKTAGANNARSSDTEKDDMLLQRAEQANLRLLSTIRRQKMK